MVRITLLALIFSAQVFAQIGIVSDLDDTIKQTNVQRTSRAIYNALFTQKIFSGMDSLFENMEPYGELYILSASPDLFRFNIKKLIRKNKLNPVAVFTRDLSDLGDKIRYKTETIDSVANKGYEGLILMGDDVEADPQIYLGYKGDNPSKVFAIYIHKVAGAELPVGVTGYHTAFEVALSEVNAGRMTLAQASEVGERVLDDGMEMALPRFAICPKTLEEIGMPAVAGLEELTERIGHAIANYCRSRR